MEKRAILAAVLMAGLLMLYQFLFVPQEQKKPAPPPTGPSAQAPAPGRPAESPTATTAATIPLPPSVEVPRPPERTVRIETPLYRAVVGSVGGAVERWDLHYRGDKPMVLPGVISSPGLMVLRPGQAPKPIAFTLDRDALKLDASNPQAELRLEGDDGLGLKVTQTMRFSADNYVIEREIRVANAHSVPQGAEIAIMWTAPVEWPKNQESFAGPRPMHALRLPDGSSWARREVLTSGGTFAGDARWVGFESGIGGASQSGVYLTALIPGGKAVKVAEGKREGSKRGDSKGNGAKPTSVFEIALRANVPVLAPGQAWDARLKTYLGPMEYSRLKALGVGLEKAIYFGGFPFPESWADRVPTLPMEWIAVPV